MKIITMLDVYKENLCGFLDRNKEQILSFKNGKIIIEIEDSQIIGSLEPREGKAIDLGTVSVTKEYKANVS